MKSNRREAVKKMAGLAVGMPAAESLRERMEATNQLLGANLKGQINHSVCRWCYGKIPFEDLCKAAKEIGLQSIELTGPEEWPIQKKYGLDCAMPWGANKNLSDGFNDPKYHDELVASYEAHIPKVAAAGYKNLICFSGNRRGMSDEQGLENSVKGLQRLMKTAEKHKVTLVMELLNSKVDHKDYMCDHTAWGVELAKRLGSENFKLLYDIYHMQIMEGDVIRTLKNNMPYINHIHTGGVPGRNEIDETQELYYPAIMQALVDLGYKGYVGQEFIPKRDPLTSLKQGVQICDV
ncbi:hydroxypyruvate isomerase family protein [Telluribacter sp.]|jgi:hydroxypyruvate isomerase|uniref:hydroxypyruvate isomerase family protein n=1 Tax=Telluribacter sp. TaxID=1978767 RepID=UPI002E14F3B6|nr:TIM barrel protein [Telluribacter sp.]